MSRSQGELVAHKLDATFRMIEGGGHLNEAAGYKEFKELLNDISFLMKED